MKISVVINTKNAEKTLKQALESVQNIADEIIVVDMKSTDKTLDIAKKYTSQIFSHRDIGYVEPARNFAIAKAQYEWILILDADEELSGKLAIMIQDITSKNISENLQGDCYFIPRKNIIFQKWIQHTGWWPDYQLRLFKKGHVQWEDKIHSVPTVKGSIIHLPPEEKYSIVHHNYQTISQFLKRMNRYTDIQSSENTTTQKIQENDVIEKYSSEFLHRYFAKQGWKDGMHGIALSFLQAMSETVVLLKQWERENFRKQKSSLQCIKALEEYKKDLTYWINTYYIQNATGIQKLYYILKRKIQKI